jgi:hypothetical protein
LLEKSLSFMCMNLGVTWEVNSAVACNLGGDDTVEMELDSDHVDSGCATVAGVVDSVAANGK